MLGKNTGGIGEAIAICRKKKGWSQQALGNKFNPHKSVSEISRWERNEVQPSAKHVTELLSIFGAHFQDLVTFEHRQTSQAI
jgi:transcriptional regulator with XRE-family HTH domain